MIFFPHSPKSNSPRSLLFISMYGKLVLSWLGVLSMYELRLDDLLAELESRGIDTSKITIIEGKSEKIKD